MTRLITGLIVVAIIIVGGFALLGNEEGRGDVMRLGVIASANEGAPVGAMIRHALTIAAEEINATGGLNGKTIELIIEDGGCNAQTAGIAAQKLANLDEVTAIFGGSCEIEIQAAGEIAQAAGILMITPYLRVFEHEDGDVFSIAPTESAIANISARYLIRERSLKTLALVRESSYSESFAAEFKKAFQQNSGKVVEDYIYTLENAAISEDDVKKIFAGKPDVVYVLAENIERGAGIIKQLREFEKDAAYISNLNFFTAGAVADHSEALEGVIGIGFAPDYENNDRAKSFLERYREESMGADPGSLAVGAYDALHLFADGVRRVGARTEDMESWLAHIENWPGALGPFSMEPNKTIRIGLRVKTITDGKIENSISYLP
ncbi:MAG: ABC transporter substrate-binding protein [Patescibacteria group bacterium]